MVYDVVFVLLCLLDYHGGCKLREAQRFAQRLLYYLALRNFMALWSGQYSLRGPF